MAAEPAPSGGRPVTPEWLDAVLRAVDDANAEDPNRIAFGGREQPKELVHAEVVTRWVRHLDPGASPEQLVAARAHHLRRWETPRAEHPPGRVGYRRWRREAGHRHAELVGELMAASDAPEGSIARVRAIVAKEGLGEGDAAVQTHEDALCLTFLELQLDDLADDLGDEATIGVLRRSMAKMSASGIAAASELELGARSAALLSAAAEPIAPGADGAADVS